jgi:hypothetical protein
MVSHTHDLQGLGARWAATLRRAYPGPSQAKQVANAFGADVRTAEGWLGGRAPGALVLMRAWQLHGAGFVAAVLAPAPSGPSEHDVQRLRHQGAQQAVRLGRLRAAMRADEHAE